MRLIDADELLERASKMSVSGGKYEVRVAVADAIGKTIHLLVDEAPTAYDVDKVVEQLNKKEKLSYNTYLNYGMNVDLGRHYAFQDAIKIVKMGGDE